MKIDDLINKYFEGESTCEEERQIRLFFKQENVPSHLEEYRDFFSFFDEESQLHATEIEEIAIAHKPKRLTNRYFRYGMIGIAASLILTLSIIGMNKYFDIPQNYVMIDGVCYTQTDIIMQEALNSLQAVSMSEDDILNTLLQ